MWRLEPLAGLMRPCLRARPCFSAQDVPGSSFHAQNPLLGTRLATDGFAAGPCQSLAVHAYILVRVPVCSWIPADNCHSDLTTEFSIAYLVEHSCPPSSQWRTTLPGDQQNRSFILPHSAHKKALKLLNLNYSQPQTSEQISAYC